MIPPDGQGGGSDSTSAAHHRDTLLAVTNALKLGASMIATLGIAVGVRLFMPRFLGPEGFGPVNAADAFAATFFVAITLGIDTYIRKEVSVRPEHASDVVAGLITLRLAVTALVFLAMHGVMVWTDRPPESRALVYVFGAAQFFLTMNQTFAALLHAQGTVNELSILNIVAKLVWGGGVLLALLLGWPLVAIPGALLVAEVLKGAAGLALVRRHLALRWRFDWPAVRAAVVISLPVFVNTGSHVIYNKLDVSIVAEVANDMEVAWYGASSYVAGLSLLLAPMVGWVLMPLYARARARSEDEYRTVLRRSLELVLAFGFPTSLMMALGADLWIVLLYGERFAPAALSLWILAPNFILTYVAMLSMNSLILTGQGWSQAFISMAGLAVNVLCNAVVIPWGHHHLGPGGAGVGAAVGQVLTEIFVTALLLRFVGARAFDRRLLVVVAKTLLVCAAVVAVDRVLAGALEPLAAVPAPVPGASSAVREGAVRALAWGPGLLSALLRLVLDGLAYVLLIVASGAVNVRETLAFARQLAAKGRSESDDGAATPRSPA